VTRACRGGFPEGDATYGPKSQTAAGSRCLYAPVTFPDVRWGTESSPLRRPMVALSCTRPGSWMIRTLAPVDRRLLQRWRGKYTILGPLGAPLLLLTTTGRKSGQPRTAPLLYARDGDDLIVVGSNFGQEHHPAWSGNLLANPRAVVTIGGQAVPVEAAPLDSDEAERAYGRMVEETRTYAEYRSRTDRVIRVFRLRAVRD
jgi:deazaflavin-dependent oxidoreductase (nitroreductase family)